MGQQFIVFASLSDLPPVEDDDLIGASDRRQTVRDHDHGAVLHQALQGFLNQPLGFRVEVRRRFIQDENRRILEQRVRWRASVAARR